MALKYFRVVLEGGTLDLSLSALLVEALPSLFTISLLIHYHGSSIGAARQSEMGMSLLERQPSTRSRSRNQKDDESMVGAVVK